MHDDSNALNKYASPRIEGVEKSPEVESISYALAQIPLILSGLVYLAIAVGAAIIPQYIDTDREPSVPIMLLALAIFSGLLGIAAIVLAFLLPLRSPVIYFTVFAVTVLYLPSAFFVFGIPMLIFLLRTEVRQFYGVKF